MTETAICFMHNSLCELRLTLCARVRCARCHRCLFKRQHWRHARLWLGPGLVLMCCRNNSRSIGVFLLSSTGLACRFRPHWRWLMPSGSRSAQVAPPTTRRRAMGRQGYRGSRVRMPMASPNWSMVDIAYSTWNRRPAPGRVLHELDTAAQGPQATQPTGVAKSWGVQLPGNAQLTPVLHPITYHKPALATRRPGVANSPSA